MDQVTAGGGSSRFAALIDHVPGPFVVTRRADGAFLHANDEAAKLLGIPESELLTTRATTLYADPSVRGQILDTVRRDGVAQGVEVEVGIGGRRLWVLAHVKEATFEGESVLCTSFVDITDRLLHSERAERRVQRLLEQLDVGLFRSTVDGRFLECNEACERILGLDGSEMRGASLPATFADPERAEAYRQVLERDGEVTDFEVELLRGDGTRVLGLLSATTVTSTTGEQQVEGLMEDVTERRRLQSTLNQNQRLESVGRLAGGISHDFNNLLTAITAFASFAREGVDEGTPARQDIDEVLSAADRAAALVRQLLSFSRREVSEPRTVDLSAVIVRIHSLLRRTLGADIELVSLPPEGLWSVRIDPTHAEQILMNLAVNASDAMPEGGRLTIALGNHSVDDDYPEKHPDLDAGDYVVMSVSDTGVGMSREAMVRIFEPFFTTKEPGRGTGLGLSTCYGLVRQSGGHIHVHSELGRGSTFRVYLPRETGKHAASLRPTPVHEDEPAHGTETVLVVEDEPAVRRTVTRALRKHGYIVLQASNGEEAVRTLADVEGQVDLVVTDLVMPRMGGIDLAKHLEESHPGLPVVLMSGYTGDVIDGEILDRPGVAFMQKPFSPSKLVRCVRAVLDDQSR